MKKKYSLATYILLLVLINLSLYSCSPKKISKPLNQCSFAIGQVYIEQNGKVSPLKARDRFSSNAIITTGNKSTAVVTLSQSHALVEIQENAKVDLRNLTTQSEIFVNKGNIWTHVSKLTKGKKFLVRTPTSVAAVRGTKFYTFNFKDIHGTCFCEGTVHHTIAKTHKELENKDDYLLVYRGNKSAIVTADDIRKAGIKPGHNHSSIAQSPLGKQKKMTPEDAKKFYTLLKSKLQ